MKQKFCRLELACNAGGSLTSTKGLTVFGECAVYLRAHVAINGAPLLVGDAEVRVAGVGHEYAIRIEDDGQAQDSRVVAVEAFVNYGVACNVTLEVDSGATFPSGQVTAEVIFEAPDGYSFTWASDGGPSFVPTLQPD